MTQDSETKVVPFRRAPVGQYSAKISKGRLEKYSFVVSATLDGWVELALHGHDGSNNRTYQITRDDARQIIAALNLTIQDITDNCRFENDSRLYDEGARP